LYILNDFLEWVRFRCTLSFGCGGKWERRGENAYWRDDLLASGQAALKSRPADDRDEEIARLRAKVGELTMDNELLLQRCRGDHPLVPRRRKG
jgi:hypothetical protein